MQELVNAIGNGFGVMDVFSFMPDVASLLHMDTEKVSIAAVFSGAGSVILGKFTDSVGYLTMPMNYCALFGGALVSNWAFQNVRMPMLDATLQTPIVLTVAGMTVTALAVMLFARKEQI